MRDLFRLFAPGEKEGEQEEENGGAGDRARQACQVHAVNDTPAGFFVERSRSGRQRRPCHAGVFPRMSCPEGLRTAGGFVRRERPHQLPDPQHEGDSSKDETSNYPAKLNILPWKMMLFNFPLFI